jgi:hypothetical protein
MKKALLLTLVFMLSATMAFAQSEGLLGIFQDTQGLDCNLVDGPALSTWHFVHLQTIGITAVQFKATMPACFIGTFFGDAKPFPVAIGDSQTGIAIAFLCQTPPVHVLSASFFSSASTPPCCFYPVTGDPLTASGTIEVVDCLPAGNLLPNVPSQSGVITSDATCLCAVPVEETTWGHIKSLYSTGE